MMSSWAERMHQRATSLSTLVISCGQSSGPHPKHLEKVKFGVPLEQVCQNDIPAPLLILILKLNKEAPFKKDIFRAPGNQQSIKKLIHFLEIGHLVNIEQFSVYTIASVLKRFLRKLPQGIFGSEGEEKLFRIIELQNLEEQRDEIHKILNNLPIITQHLLVLLFGTFRMVILEIENNSSTMTSEAIGVSVAPSFFHSCVNNNKQVCMDDVQHFKIATRIIQMLIDNFGVTNLFGRNNYEYYARITGRILRIEEDWIFTFKYPVDWLIPRMSRKVLYQIVILELGRQTLETEKRWLKHESERWGLNLNQRENLKDCFKSPVVEFKSKNLKSEAKFKNIVNMKCIFNPLLSLEELKNINHFAESTRSLSFLPEIHERQAARMRSRSEWFLSSRSHNRESLTFQCLNQRQFLSYPAFVHSFHVGISNSSGNKKIKESSKVVPHITENDCTMTDVHSFHVVSTYKPRI